MTPPLAGATFEDLSARTGLLLWCLFIVYGSFFPFHFTADSEFVRENVENIQISPVRDGRRNFSILDVASNVLLFVPFGFLAAASGRPPASGRRWAGRIAVTGLGASALATAIEGGQLFAPGRTSSAIDVAANAAGALGGAGGAWLLSRLSGERLLGSMVGRVRADPALLLLGALGVAIAADGFYPFAITLDVSTVWLNVKRTRWLPFTHPTPRVWIDLLMDKVLTFSLFAAVLRRSLSSLGGSAGVAGSAWLATVLFAAAVEVGKLGFAGRSPNADNVVLAAAGALAGVTLIPLIVGAAPIRSHPALALLALAVVLLVHIQMTPFEFRLTRAAIAAKIARIEWLPFASYYHADPQLALFDLWQKLLRYGLLGFSVAGLSGRGPWVATVMGMAAGAVLEAAQLFTVARSTSMTDVVIAGVGAFLGGALHARYRAWRAAGG